MKALTVKQPWAWAIATGAKTVENRSRNTHHRGLVAIHAGLSWSQRGAKDWRIKALIRDHEFDCPTGAIVATAQVVGAHQAAQFCCKNEWGDCLYDGSVVWHWQLADIHRLAVPVPCRGALGLWTVPDEIAEALS